MQRDFLSYPWFGSTRVRLEFGLATPHPYTHNKDLFYYYLYSRGLKQGIRYYIYDFP